jgi:hypothetical protein
MGILKKFTQLLSVIFITGIITMLQSCGGGGDDDPDPVVVNEDIFINEVYASGDDWIELYNVGAATKDIGGYIIYDDVLKKYVIPANTIIQPKGFLILHCDDAGTGLHTNFKLSSTGETISLETNGAKLIDRVEFPGLTDGQSYARIPDGSNILVITGNPTQGATNNDSQSPAITNVVKTPLIPDQDDPITVSATVNDNTGLSSVKLFYRINNAAFIPVTMTLTTNAIYSGSIPAVGNDGKIEYYIEAKNTADKLSLSPFDAPDDLHTFLINSDALPNLFINEVMAANITCCADTDGGTNEFDDWIEIYNGGDVAVNIAGMHLSDDPANPFKFKVPSSNPTKTTVQPGGFLLIWADETKEQGELHASFKLSNQGESIGLYYIDGRTIDQKTFGPQNDDASFGRITDGADTWKVFNSPTIGSSND